MPNTPASDGAFGSRGSRQMDMQACPLGPLLAAYKCPSIISKVSEELIQHVSVKKCQDEKNWQKETSV